MKNLWKKVLSAILAVSLTAGFAFGITITLDAIGIGSTTAPTLTCGTSPTFAGNDLGGTVTVGTASPTSCVIPFAVTKSAAPNCVVGSTPQLAAFSWTIATTGITVTQTATSSNKISYVCIGQ